MITHHINYSENINPLQIEDTDATENEEYLSRDFLIKEEPVDCVNWKGANEHIVPRKRSPSESRTLEYYEKIKKSFIKTEVDISSHNSVIECEFHKIPPKNDETMIECLSELYSETEYDRESDVSIEILDHSDFVFVEASTSTTQDYVNPKHMYLQDCLQLPVDENAMQCPSRVISNPLCTNLGNHDSDSSSSDQLSVQQSQSTVTPDRDSVSRILPLQNAMRMDFQKQPQVCGSESEPAPQQVDCRDYSKDRNKTVSDLPQVKSIRVQKWTKNTNTVESHCPVRKTINKKDRLDGVKKRPHHNNRRITRSLIKGIKSIADTTKKQIQIGNFVWGYCKGWWPAIIIAAEDAGLQLIADKVCVYWIAKDIISQLDEKTQVERFATNLDTRLMKYLRNDNGCKNRRKACFVTLKRFSTYLNIPLQKPYATWAENHLMGKTHLNYLKFHPFPKLMQQRLGQLKQQNIKVTQEMARNEARAMRLSHRSSSPTNDKPIKSNNLDKKTQDNGAESKFPKNFIRKSAKEMLIKTLAEQHILPLIDQHPGVIVWGKITGHDWWPAIIIHNQDCGKKEPNFGCQWILWYGDYQLSEVHYENVMKFEEGMKKMQDYIRQCEREKYMNAILTACKDHCAWLSYDTNSWNIDNVLAWVSSLNNNNLKMCAISRPNDGNLESKYPSHIAEKLKEMKSNQQVASERENRIKKCDALKAVFAGAPSTLKILCIICLKVRDNLLEHPFFACAVCKDCVEEIKATVFAYGDDGKCFYCTLCTGSDTMVICDSVVDCPRAYCAVCLKYLISPTEYDGILTKDPWLCFLCTEAQEATKNRIFKPRSDWKTRVDRLFHTNQNTSPNNTSNNDGKSRKIRVLSLFDGISTGLLALEKLGIEVEAYYASEIDVNAKLVSSVYFGDRIHQLGDVKDITKDTIEGISPIDLLIGSSPCNDLSLVNPNRLGLHDPQGTGILFFDYCRIKKLVLEANKGRHLFWMFENLASMPSEYRLAMNKALECEPSLIDAADFSPLHRPRLYWGNLPSRKNFPLPDPAQNLQSVLSPYCNRLAVVKKIRTVNTKANSPNQGVSFLKPVLYNGVANTLWTTELETIFGLPKCYTDVNNLSPNKRQELIGQASSVQTITALLLPLIHFFYTKSSQLPNR